MKNLTIFIVFFIKTANSSAISTKLNDRKLTFDRKKVKASLLIPVFDKPKILMPSLSSIKKRVYNPEKIKTIEPIFISVKPNQESILDKARKFARPRHKVDLFNYLIEAPKGYFLPKSPSKLKRVILDRQSLNFIQPEKLRRQFRSMHHELEINAKKLRKNPELLSRLEGQISLFLSKRQLKIFKKQIMIKDRIPVNRYLLPEFAKKNIGKFPIHTGLNCFHASIAFQNKKLPTLPFVNLREEPNHHPLMINNDELWRALNVYFYEIDPAQNDIKYGDIVAFFDVPVEGSPNPNYRALKHAASYLFSGFLFSKGSKSPNSPYSIKTLDEEWQTWSKHTERLAVKIFRRSFEKISLKSPFIRSDWLY